MKSRTMLAAVVVILGVLAPSNQAAFAPDKAPGWGREMGGEVLANYTEIKAVTAKL